MVNESKLKKLLGIKTKTISKEKLKDKLGILSYMDFDVGAKIKCQADGDLDKKMRELKTIGIMERGGYNPQIRLNVYLLTKKGYDVMTLAQDYLGRKVE